LSLLVSREVSLFLDHANSLLGFQFHSFQLPPGLSRVNQLFLGSCLGSCQT
jgi:hypothetical protein